MRKEELRRLRALPATKEMMEKGKRFKEVKEKLWYSGTTYTRIVSEYDLLIRVQNLNGYIKVAVFLPEWMRKDIKTPAYEIFVNVAGEEWITRKLDEQGKEVQWLTAMADNLTGQGNWSWKLHCKKIYANHDAMQSLSRLPLEKKDNTAKGMYRLCLWQTEQREKNIKKREEREQAPWDADMALIPEIPKGFEEWMRKEAANKYYIIYEYDPKGQKTGFCSKCKRFVPISNPRHRAKSKCPLCKAEGTFRAHSRLQTLTTEWYSAEIIQKFHGGIVVRTFEQGQWYRDREYVDPNIYTREYERIMIFDDGRIKRYDWGFYKNKYQRWIYDKNYIPRRRSYYHDRTVKLYKRNLGQLKRHSFLKQSAIDLWPELPCAVADYIKLERWNPAVEMLAKLGMFRLAKDIINQSYDSELFKEDETEIAKLLKIDKNRLKRLKEIDGNIWSLRWMQYEKLANTIWPDEMIKDFGEARFPTSAFNFMQTPISFVKCHNYLKKQAAIMDESIAQTLITWRDYMNMADGLKMNTKCDQIARPKDLKYAHDEAVLIKESKGLKKIAKGIEKKWPKVNEQLVKLEKYEFSLGEYTIVAPKSVLDIVTEGTILKHCVHTCDYYFSRIQNDESYLFFLRHSKQPEMPWYTLEVEPSGNIRQKRTTGDNQNADFQNAVPFLKKWQKHFQKQLTEEEKLLGEKADELRKENYKNLRENGNKVWHGRLAGKLLADVLEADFMAAGM